MRCRAWHSDQRVDVYVSRIGFDAWCEIGNRSHYGVCSWGDVGHRLAWSNDAVEATSCMRGLGGGTHRSGHVQGPGVRCLGIGSGINLSRRRCYCRGGPHRPSDY